jgi:hypothetical protein
MKKTECFLGDVFGRWTNGLETENMGNGRVGGDSKVKSRNFKKNVSSKKSESKGLEIRDLSNLGKYEGNRQNGENGGKIG